MDGELEEKLKIYTRTGNEDGAQVECYFCKECGVRVLHRRRNENGYGGGVVMIKGGLVEGLKWEGGIHIHTENAVMPIPEGAEQYEGEPPSI